MLKKKIEENMRLEIANFKMNDGLCQALSAVGNVRVFLINFVEFLS
jgi:hypothetical protein